MPELLPPSFHFSQNSLQDYVDCARRFQLRYVLVQPWPALVTGSPSEAEQQVQRAVDLHRLAHQYALGLDAAQLAASLADPVLARWWQTFLERPPRGLPTKVRRAEVGLSAPVMGYRLIARLDLLAIEPGERAVVVDWKTPLSRPPRLLLRQRMQTRVYRYLTVTATSALNGGQPFSPAQVEMIYWFAEFGGTTESFAYDADQYSADSADLSQLIAEITGQHGAIWPLTGDERRCQFCNYRSLCEREVEPGFLKDLDDDLEAAAWDTDLEQIAEIAF